MVVVLYFFEKNLAIYFVLDSILLCKVLYFIFYADIMYTEDSVSKQMKKGTLEYLVLLILDKKQLYVSEIIALLSEHNLLVVEGTLYPLLSRLKRDGLLKHQRAESPSGPPRKYYTLSDKGHTALGIMREVRNNITDTVQAIEELK